MLCRTTVFIVLPLLSSEPHETKCNSYLDIVLDVCLNSVNISFLIGVSYNETFGNQDKMNQFVIGWNFRRVLGNREPCPRKEFLISFINIFKIISSSNVSIYAFKVLFS